MIIIRLIIIIKIKIKIVMILITIKNDMELILYVEYAYRMFIHSYNTSNFILYEYIIK